MRSPRSRLDRLGIEHGVTAAVAGPVDPAFRRELEARAVITAGAPRRPVDLLVLAAADAAMLANLGKLMPFVAAGGAVLLIAPTQASGLPASKVQGTARAAGLREAGSLPFSATHTVHRFTKGA